MQRATHQRARSRSNSRGPRSVSPSREAPAVKVLDDAWLAKLSHLDIATVVDEGMARMFAEDDEGSKFLRAKLSAKLPDGEGSFRNMLPDEECRELLMQLLPSAKILAFLPNGSAVLQVLMLASVEEYRHKLAEALKGRFFDLAQDGAGCSLVQKMLDVLEDRGRMRIYAELRSHTDKLIFHLHGNHVIQKCLEKKEASVFNVVMDHISKKELSTSRHVYGCRIVQKLLGFSDIEDERVRRRVDELVRQLLVHTKTLSKDQYGNFVIRFMLDTQQWTTQIIRNIAEDSAYLATKKWSSSVVEKCLDRAGPDEKDLLLRAMTKEPEKLQAMLKRCRRSARALEAELKRAELLAIEDQLKPHAPMLKLTEDESLARLQGHHLSPDELRRAGHAVAGVVARLSKTSRGAEVVKELLMQCEWAEQEELVQHPESGLKVHAYELAKDAYGCRVLQEVMKLTLPPSQSSLKLAIVQELEAHVQELLFDLCGSHVISVIVEKLMPADVAFVTDAVLQQGALKVAKDTHGCHVVQKLFQYCCKDERMRLVVADLKDHVLELATDASGNFVIQHMLEHVTDQPDAAEIGERFRAALPQILSNPYASYVVKKYIEDCDDESEILLKDILVSRVDELQSALAAQRPDPSLKGQQIFPAERILLAMAERWDVPLERLDLEQRLQ